MYRRYCPGGMAYRPVSRPARANPSPAGLLSGLLPPGLDMGDLILFGVLLLLYLDTRDEEYLIMLVAVMM